MMKLASVSFHIVNSDEAEDGIVWQIRRAVRQIQYRSRFVEQTQAIPARVLNFFQFICHSRVAIWKFHNIYF